MGISSVVVLMFKFLFFNGWALVPDCEALLPRLVNKYTPLRAYVKHVYTWALTVEYCWVSLGIVGYELKNL